MPFTELANLKIFTFDSINQTGLTHAVFTRKGGVSPAPWNTLNTGGLSGDGRANVIENRRRIFEAVHLPIESLFDVWQVHSCTIVSCERPRPLDTPHQKADAIITDKRGVTLFMRFGDCVPILIVDPIRHAVGIAHAGWQGTVSRIAEKTVNAMISQFGCKPEHMIAGIGPSIGPDHYPVGPEVALRVKTAFPEDPGILVHRNEKIFLDLWKANQICLTDARVPRIESAGICTACHTEDWYSHRAEQGKTGRFAALISLNEWAK